MHLSGDAIVWKAVQTVQSDDVLGVKGQFTWTVFVAWNQSNVLGPVLPLVENIRFSIKVPFPSGVRLICQRISEVI